MSEITTNDTALATNPAINLGIPPYGIDLKVILMAVRDDMLYQRLHFTKNHAQKCDVVIPTLRENFVTRYVDGHIIIKQRKSIRIPVTFDGCSISEETINIMCAWLESLRINQPIF